MNATNVLERVPIHTDDHGVVTTTTTLRSPHRIAASFAGIPLMFLAGWWVGGWWERAFAVKAALVVWLTYALIDIGVLLAAGPTPRIAVLSAVSLLTKLAAVYLASVGCRSSRLKPS